MKFETKKNLVDKMATALDVNPYTLYDTAERDASEMMELLFWLNEFNSSALHLFLPRKFPGEKCNEVADTSVYYHNNDSWPARLPCHGNPRCGSRNSHRTDSGSRRGTFV